MYELDVLLLNDIKPLYDKREVMEEWLTNQAVLKFYYSVVI